MIAMRHQKIEEKEKEREIVWVFLPYPTHP
jgi:hypothetical protein